MLNFIDIKNNNTNIEFAKNLYNEAFPPSERWNFELTIQNKENNDYTFYIISDLDNSVGITMIWNFEKFYYIEYLAIDKNLRGKNYGSKALNSIIEKFNDKMIVLEVEPYNLNEISKKRIDWYKKFNFLLLENDYDMPSIDENKNITTIKMQIMTNREINDIEYKEIVNKLISTVYKPRLDKINEWI